MTPYRDAQTELAAATQLAAVAVPLKCEIHASTCWRFGPFAGGRIKCGHRTYWVFACPLITVWL